MRWAFALVAMTGCSQLFGLSAPVREDASAGNDDTMRMDTSRDTPPATTCVGKWQSGAVALSLPVMLGASEIATDDEAPFVTADGLELLYARDGDVFRASRTTLTVDFTSAQKVQNVTSGSPEGKTFVSSNKLHAFFASARPGSGGFDIWRGSRSSVGSNFAPDQMYLANVNTAANEIDPHLTDDLLHLYLAGVPSGSASQQLLRATRATVSDVFSTPTAIAELVTNTGESGPTLTEDELVIVYSSNKLVSSGPGGSNLWYATRANATDPFGTAQIVPTVNSDTFDVTPHLSPDGCTLYFSSARGQGYDLYTSTIQ